MTKCHSTVRQVLENIVIVKCLKKKEVLFCGNRQLKIDLTIMEAFIMKEIDTSDYHVNCYPTQKTLWMHLKSKGLRNVLN